MRIGMHRDGILFKDKTKMQVPNCLYCHSSDVITYGLQKNKVQRFQCNTCQKIFNHRYTGRYSIRNVSPTMKLGVVYLFLTGYPMSNMPLMFDITENAIRDLLKQVFLQFQKFKQCIAAPADYIPRVIEIDEIYIKLQGEKKFYGWLAYDLLKKYVIDFVIGNRDDDTLEELFKKLKRFQGKIELVLIDRYQGYERFISSHLGIKRMKPLTGVSNKSRFTRKTGKFYTYGLFGVSGKTIDEVIQELGIGNKITTAFIENLNSFIRNSVQYLVRRTKRLAFSLDWVIQTLAGYFFFRNFVRPYWSLSKRSSKNWLEELVTSTMACGITAVPLSLYEIVTFHQF